MARIREQTRGWPTWRRLMAFVLLPLLLCCCGSVVTVPVVWFLRGTVAAGAGQPSPDAAANVYLLALSAGREDGLLPALSDGHRDDLLAQWRAYRAEILRTDPPPSKLEFNFTGVTAVGQGRAEVVAEVNPVWWNHGNGGTSMHGTRHPWRLTAVDDDGWRVEAVTEYPWCDGYVRADACR